MSVGPDSARPGLGPQWIKANVIGAVINAVVSLFVFLLGRMLGVSDAGASVAVQAIYVVIATVALTFGLLVLGYLTGVVLRTRLPAFPMRNWLAFSAAVGVIVGLVSAFAWLSPDAPEDIGPVEPAVLAGLVIGAAIAGTAIGAALGSAQALILHPAARGLGLWIACCALSGSSFALIVPALLYGPQSPYASELTMNAITLVVTVLAAFILLPAVHRLQPQLDR